MKTTKLLPFALLCMFFATSTHAQSPHEMAAAMDRDIKEQRHDLSTFVIEREILDAGSLSPEALTGISQKSCEVIRELGRDIQWVHSYVTDNKVFCIYRASDEEILRKHAEKGGFPINRVHRLSATIGPETSSTTNVK